MKKIILHILLLSAALCLSGCGGEQNTSEHTSAGTKEESAAVSGRKDEEALDTEAVNAESEKTTEAEAAEKAEKSKGEQNEQTTQRELITAVSPSIAPEDMTDASIIISKTNHTLTLYNGTQEVAVYSVGLAKNSVGAKEKEGDNKNPEGKYYVSNKNSGSQYHLALGLSYPNKEDALRGFEDGLITEAQRDSITAAIESGGKPDWYTPLGGEIMIHGQKGELGGSTDWTRGCFAVDNEVMDYIWDYIQVGTTVTITK